MKSSVVSTAVIWSTILAVSPDTRAGAPTYHGSEECIWANKSLIVARVLGTEKTREAGRVKGFAVNVRLKSKMTLCGSFDCSANDEITVPIVLGDFGSHLSQPPPPGSLIVVHLELCNDG